MPSIDDILYTDGTISIGAGAVAVVGVGTMWSLYNAPDKFFLILIVPGKGAAIVSGVTDDTHLVIPAWQGSAVAPGTAYQLVALPFSSLVVEKRIRDFLEQTVTQGIPYVVPDDQEEPNDAIGDDGTVAIRFNPKPIVFWKRVDGIYVFQGNFVGVGARGAWRAFEDDGVTPVFYFAGDIVTDLGVAYIANSGSNNTNKRPASNIPAFWTVFVQGGRRIEISARAAGKPGSAESLISRVFSTRTIFPATLPESILRAGVAATSSAVFSLRKNGAQFATATIAPSNTHASFSSAADVVFVADDIFDLIAPASQDASLADLVGTFIASL